MGVLIGPWARATGAAPPIVREIFCIKYILWRQQWTATIALAEQRPDTRPIWQHSAVAAASSFQTSIPNADHTGNAAVMTCERVLTERVFSNADVRPFYDDGG